MNSRKKIERARRIFRPTIIENFHRKIGLKDDIVEMRYVNGVLDYVENMEVAEFDDEVHVKK